MLCTISRKEANKKCSRPPLIYAHHWSRKWTWYQNSQLPNSKSSKKWTPVRSEDSGVQVRSRMLHACSIMTLRRCIVGVPWECDGNCTWLRGWIWPDGLGSLSDNDHRLHNGVNCHDVCLTSSPMLHTLQKGIIELHINITLKPSISCTTDCVYCKDTQDMYCFIIVWFISLSYL